MVPPSMSPPTSPCHRLVSLLFAALVLVPTTASLAVQSGPTDQQPSLRGLQFPSDERLLKVVLDQRMEQLLSKLKSPLWKLRNDAMGELASAAYSNEQLLAAMRQFELDSEQRARLLTILSRRILDAPSGAVGIRMNAGFGGQRGVQVEAVIDGMPAAGLLKAGDLITQIDDQLVRRSSDLTGIVQSKLPGDLITVVLERTRVDQNGEFLLDVNGEIRRETVEVRFALGSIEQLSSDGGNVVRSSSVRSERARWVQQLLDRFASDPVRITIAESALKVDSFIGRGVEQHPAMIWLSGISIALERGTIEMDPNLRLQIFRRLSAIEAETAAESISPEERAWLELVAERYALVVEELNR